MDAHRGLNDQDADKALRDLFRSSGRLTAPEGLDARVLQRIALVNRPITPAAGLIPTWVWIALAGGFAAFVAYIYSGATTDTVGRIERVLSGLPRFPISDLLSSPWVLLTACSAVAFLAMDSLLERTDRMHGLNKARPL